MGGWIFSYRIMEWHQQTIDTDMTGSMKSSKNVVTDREGDRETLRVTFVLEENLRWMSLGICTGLQSQPGPMDSG